MKIIVRIPTVAYAYHEVHFENQKEYNEGYPKFIADYIAMQKTIATLKDKLEIPFVN